MRTSSHSLATIALGLALVLGGCTSETSAPEGPDGPNDPTNPGIPGGNVESAFDAELQAVASDEVDESLLSLLVEVPTTPSFLMSAPATAGVPEGLPPGCMTIAPRPPENPDGDRVPTALTVTWDETACAHERGGRNLTLFGTLDLSDPQPTTAGFDLALAIEGAGVSHERADGATVTVTRNGSVAVSGTESGLSATEELTVLRQVTDHADLQVTKSWDVTFTPDAGETFAFDAEKPSGEIAGSGSWTFAGETTVVTEVETVTPLHYNNKDAACTAQEPNRRLDRGELRLRRIQDGVAGDYLKLTWTACGVEPTREVVESE